MAFAPTFAVKAMEASEETANIRFLSVIPVYFIGIIR